MINIYKSGGCYKKIDGTEYSIKTINTSDKAKYMIDGWVSSLDMVGRREHAEFEEVKDILAKSRKKMTKG